jgi:hypothetical protein
MNYVTVMALHYIFMHLPLIFMQSSTSLEHDEP